VGKIAEILIGKPPEIPSAMVRPFPGKKLGNSARESSKLT